MSLRVVGAGLGRTGTHSLKLALEQLLGAPCYHMLEVFGRPEHVAEWQRAVGNGTPDWDLLFDGYAAAVDWPAAAFYERLMDRNPKAIVLLSTRQDGEAWWRSASATIFQAIDRVSALPAPMEHMVIDMLNAQFTPQWRDRDASIAAYLRHNQEVRDRVPADRLVEWQAGDGWEPIARALGVSVPAEPFPHVNSTTEFRAMIGLD